MFRSWIARVLQISSRPSRRSRRTARRLPGRTFRPSLEVLEARSLLSVTPVSIASSPTTMGNGPSSVAADAISDNGQYEVFSSSATNLVSGKTINANSSNVYRRDLVHGATSLVSANSAGTAGVLSGDYAAAPALTADGRYVAFVSDYDNLTGDGNIGFSPQLFVRDMTQGKTYLVSSSYDGWKRVPAIGESNGQFVIAYSADSSGKGGNNASLSPVLSKDGSTVMFNSYATNLNVPGGYSDNNSWVENLYLYSLSSHTLKLLSAEPTTGTNATGNDSSSITELNLPGAVPAKSQTVSGNGQYVVFTSQSDNLVAGAATFVDTSNVYRRDLKAGTTQMVSISTSGTGVGGYAFDPIITSNGRYVAFFSEPSYGTYDHGLTSNDTRGGFFVRDMTQGQTYMVSNNATMKNVTWYGGPTIGENSNGQLVIAYEVADSSGNSHEPLPS